MKIRLRQKVSSFVGITVGKSSIVILRSIKVCLIQIVFFSDNPMNNSRCLIVKMILLEA